MTLPELEVFIKDLASKFDEVWRRSAVSSTISFAVVESVDEKYSTCNIRMVDTNFLIKNVPIRMTLLECMSGNMPDIGSTVHVEHRGEALGAHIIKLSTLEVDNIKLAQEDKGDLRLRTFIPKG